MKAIVMTETPEPTAGPSHDEIVQAMAPLQAEAADLLDLALSDAQMAQFVQVAEALIDWNANRMNLTTIVEPNEVRVRHFLDSLTLTHVMGFDAGDRLIDVGTGAGFPGLVLAIALPQLHVTLLDSTRKKLDFIQHIVGQTGISNVTLLHSRAEDAGRDKAHRGQYDVVVARAVARLPSLLEYLLPFARGGWLLHRDEGRGRRR